MDKFLRLSFFILAWNIYMTVATQVSLKGREYLAYSLKGYPIPTDKNYISFRFKTIHPSGLLVYSRGKSDYIQLELVNGVLKFTLYLGGEEETEIRAGEDLFNGVWHSVEVTRRERETQIKIDAQTPTTKLSPGLYDHLNLDNYIFVGGMTDRAKKHLGIRAHHYRGCLDDMKFDDIKLLEGAEQSKVLGQTGNTPYTLYGDISFKCELEDYRPVTFMTPQSYVKVTLPKLPQDNDTFSTSFKFRTFYPHGLLFSRSAIKVKLNVRLRSGVLLYDITAPNGSKTQIKLGNKLDDGEWHDVNATISPPKLQLTIDGHTRAKILNLTSLLLDFSNKSRMKIFAGKGGSLSKFPGFVGCMLNLKVDSHKIVNKYMRKQRHSHGVDPSKCSTRNRCFPDPCHNRGICSQDWEKFHCDCSNTYFEGVTCQNPIFKSTCEDYKSLGLKADAHCLLHSGENLPEDRYTVLCNVTEPQRTYTVIKHNLVSGTKVRKGHFINGQYVHNIKYHDANMRQIAALIAQSKHCRQFIRFDCIKSRLLNSPNGPSFAFWVSRDGKNQNYWGGAAPGSGSCACGMSNPSQCDNPSKFCNCDIRDNKWRMDEGYLEQKELLPVMNLMFSEKSARSTFVLGQLECWGKNDDIKAKTSVDQLLKKACYPVVEPPTAPPTTLHPTKSSLPRPGEPCSIGEICSNDSAGGVTTTAPWYVWSEQVTTTDSTTDDNVQEQRGQKQPAEDDSSLGTPAIVLISCALIILVLLAMKFVLPRVIVCVRTHSKRGEYIVPPTGSGYPARLMPLVAKRSSIRGRQLTNHPDAQHVPNELNNVNASGGVKSYWV